MSDSTTYSILSFTSSTLVSVSPTLCFRSLDKPMIYFISHCISSQYILKSNRFVRFSAVFAWNLVEQWVMRQINQLNLAKIEIMRQKILIISPKWARSTALIFIKLACSTVCSRNLPPHGPAQPLDVILWDGESLLRHSNPGFSLWGCSCRCQFNQPHRFPVLCWRPFVVVGCSKESC